MGGSMYILSGIGFLLGNAWLAYIPAGFMVVFATIAGVTQWCFASALYAILFSRPRRSSRRQPPSSPARAVSVLLCLAAGGQAEEPKVPEVPLPVVRSPQVEAKPVAYFGVISRYHPVVMYEEYQPMMHYLTSQTPYRFELKLGKTYEDAVNYLQQGEVQIASLGAVTYLEAHALFEAVPILRPLNKKGDPSYRSIIVTRKDSDLKTLGDLKGRTFAFASVHSTSGNLFGRYVLKQAGVQLEDLHRYTNFKHHDQVAKAVLAQQCAAGSVKDIVAYRYQSKGLRFLHISDPIPSVPLVVRPDVPEAFVHAVKTALLRIDLNNPEHQRMLAEWNEEFKYGFVETTDADYEPIRTMLNAIPESCGSSCHPVHGF